MNKVLWLVLSLLLLYLENASSKEKGSKNIISRPGITTRISSIGIGRTFDKGVEDTTEMLERFYDDTTKWRHFQTVPSDIKNKENSKNDLKNMNNQQEQIQKAEDAKFSDRDLAIAQTPPEYKIPDAVLPVALSKSIMNKPSSNIEEDSIKENNQEGVDESEGEASDISGVNESTEILSAEVDSEPSTEYLVADESEPSENQGEFSKSYEVADEASGNEQEYKFIESSENNEDKSYILHGEKESAPDYNMYEELENMSSGIENEQSSEIILANEKDDIGSDLTYRFVEEDNPKGIYNDKGKKDRKVRFALESDEESDKDYRYTEEEYKGKEKKYKSGKNSKEKVLFVEGSDDSESTKYNFVDESSQEQNFEGDISEPNSNDRNNLKSLQPDIEILEKDGRLVERPRRIRVPENWDKYSPEEKRNWIKRHRGNLKDLDIVDKEEILPYFDRQRRLENLEPEFGVSEKLNLKKRSPKHPIVIGESVDYEDPQFGKGKRREQPKTDIEFTEEYPRLKRQKRRKRYPNEILEGSEEINDYNMQNKDKRNRYKASQMYDTPDSVLLIKKRPHQVEDVTDEPEYSFDMSQMDDHIQLNRRKPYIRTKFEDLDKEALRELKKGIRRVKISKDNPLEIIPLVSKFGPEIVFEEIKRTRKPLLEILEEGEIPVLYRSKLPRVAVRWEELSPEERLNLKKEWKEELKRGTFWDEENFKAIWGLEKRLQGIWGNEHTSDITKPIIRGIFGPEIPTELENIMLLGDIISSTAPDNIPRLSARQHLNFNSWLDPEPDISLELKGKFGLDEPISSPWELQNFSNKLRPIKNYNWMEPLNREEALQLLTSNIAEEDLGVLPKLRRKYPWLKDLKDSEVILPIQILDDFIPTNNKPKGNDFALNPENYWYYSEIPDDKKLNNALVEIIEQLGGISTKPKKKSRHNKPLKIKSNSLDITELLQDNRDIVSDWDLETMKYLRSLFEDLYEDSDEISKLEPKKKRLHRKNRNFPIWYYGTPEERHREKALEFNPEVGAGIVGLMERSELDKVYMDSSGNILQPFILDLIKEQSSEIDEENSEVYSEEYEEPIKLIEYGDNNFYLRDNKNKSLNFKKKALDSFLDGPKRRVIFDDYDDVSESALSISQIDKTPVYSGFNPIKNWTPFGKLRSKQSPKVIKVLEGEGEDILDTIKEYHENDQSTILELLDGVEQYKNKIKKKNGDNFDSVKFINGQDDRDWNYNKQIRNLEKPRKKSTNKYKLKKKPSSPLWYYDESIGDFWDDQLSQNNDVIDNADNIKLLEVIGFQDEADELSEEYRNTPIKIYKGKKKLRPEISESSIEEQQLSEFIDSGKQSQDTETEFELASSEEMSQSNPRLRNYGFFEDDLDPSIILDIDQKVGRERSRRRKKPFIKASNDPRLKPPKRALTLEDMRNLDRLITLDNHDLSEVRRLRRDLFDNSSANADVQALKALLDKLHLDKVINFDSIGKDETFETGSLSDIESECTSEFEPSESSVLVSDFTEENNRTNDSEKLSNDISDWDAVIEEIKNIPFAGKKTFNKKSCKQKSINKNKKSEKKSNNQARGGEYSYKYLSPEEVSTLGDLGLSPNIIKKVNDYVKEGPEGIQKALDYILDSLEAGIKTKDESNSKSERNPKKRNRKHNHNRSYDLESISPSLARYVKRINDLIGPHEALDELLSRLDLDLENDTPIPKSITHFVTPQVLAKLKKLKKEGKKNDRKILKKMFEALRVPEEVKKKRLLGELDEEDILAVERLRKNGKPKQALDALLTALGLDPKLQNYNRDIASKKLNDEYPKRSKFLSDISVEDLAMVKELTKQGPEGYNQAVSNLLKILGIPLASDLDLSFEESVLEDSSPTEKNVNLRTQKRKKILLPKERKGKIKRIEFDEFSSIIPEEFTDRLKYGVVIPENKAEILKRVTPPKSILKNRSYPPPRYTDKPLLSPYEEQVRNYINNRRHKLGLPTIPGYHYWSYNPNLEGRASYLEISTPSQKRKKALMNQKKRLQNHLNKEHMVPVSIHPNGNQAVKKTIMLKSYVDDELPIDKEEILLFQTPEYQDDELYQIAELSTLSLPSEQKFIPNPVPPNMEKPVYREEYTFISDEDPLQKFYRISQTSPILDISKVPEPSKKISNLVTLPLDNPQRTFYGYINNNLSDYENSLYSQDYIDYLKLNSDLTPVDYNQAMEKDCLEIEKKLKFKDLYCKDPGNNEKKRKAIDPKSLIKAVSKMNRGLAKSFMKQITFVYSVASLYFDRFPVVKGWNKAIEHHRWVALPLVSPQSYIPNIGGLNLLQKMLWHQTLHKSSRLSPRRVLLIVLSKNPVIKTNIPESTVGIEHFANYKTPVYLKMNVEVTPENLMIVPLAQLALCIKGALQIPTRDIKKLNKSSKSNLGSCYIGGIQSHSSAQKVYDIVLKFLHSNTDLSMAKFLIIPIRVGNEDLNKQILSGEQLTTKNLKFEVSEDAISPIISDIDFSILQLDMVRESTQEVKNKYSAELTKLSEDLIKLYIIHSQDLETRSLRANGPKSIVVPMAFPQLYIKGYKNARKLVNNIQNKYRPIRGSRSYRKKLRPGFILLVNDPFFKLEESQSSYLNKQLIKIQQFFANPYSFKNYDAPKHEGPVLEIRGVNSLEIRKYLLDAMARGARQPATTPLVIVPIYVDASKKEGKILKKHKKKVVEVFNTN
ncbi:uncharacterized protein CMU_018600 [Cryptosporidium muris RN66]|uniref:Uncharacterized protein n=1 Tax=Cryptosporidium muris (strain RN66) TaxID=441375 RepID=B6AD99_CRYMR|nr:uncharacterized protein CMU_018600 [Cryptosporidium muris RN66]EEA06103.1 hypothetical protein, conserved [Cryptosporidium muris RN66]|eukprot:XP_002140452.1 hypothetical protein [Cryptosporidium muris RN66]